MSEATRTYKLPLLPARPSKCIGEKKEVTQAMIDSVLQYDPSFRKAVVYANKESAHGNGNTEVAASVLRTFEEYIGGEPWIVGEVLPHRRYSAENQFENLAAADGDYPGRSVELYPQALIPNCPTPYWLEAVALCGSHLPATVSLPPLYYSESRDGIILFATEEQPADDMAAIARFAKENKIELNGNREGFEKAERGARARWPVVFGIRVKPAADPGEQMAAIARFAKEHNIELDGNREAFEKAELGARKAFPEVFKGVI